MKSFFALTFLAGCAVAQQRLQILEPTALQTFASGSSFTVELQQPVFSGSFQPGAVVIAISQCLDVCDEGPSQWPISSVLFSGAFNPQFDPTVPQKGHFQDFAVQIPSDFETGEAVVSVAHQFESGGAILEPVFEFTSQFINVG